MSAPLPGTGRPDPAASGRARRRRLNGSLVVGGVIVLGFPKVNIN